MFIGDSPEICARIIFQRDWWTLAGFPLKVNNDEVTTSRITVLNIRKLYLYIVYFKLYVYFEWSLPVPSKNDARATSKNYP